MAKDKFKGATALVTGASSGIGSFFARGLAQRGANLILVARSADKLSSLAKEITEAYGVSVKTLSQDLSVPGAAEEIFKSVQAQGQTVDILVNNAGVGLFGLALDQDLALIRSMVEVNVQALTVLCSLFGREMKARGHGSILNVASMVALMPTPFFSTYAASKAYVKSFTATFRAEMRGTGVSVGYLMPGYVKTNFDAASHVTSEAYAKFSGSMGMEPRKVAEIGVKLIKSGRGRKTAGAMNAISTFFLKLIPSALIAPVSFRFLSGMIKPAK
jgi:short-subunit dehydrogenase